MSELKSKANDMNNVNEANDMNNVNNVNDVNDINELTTMISNVVPMSMFPTVSCPSRLGTNRSRSIVASFAVKGAKPKRGEDYRHRRYNLAKLPGYIAAHMRSNLAAKQSMTDSVNDPTGLLVAINAIRASVSRWPPLVYRSDIAKVSRAWADRIANLDSLSHGDFAGRIVTVAPNSYAGEDIGIADTAESVVAAWRSDGEHRQFLIGNYDVVGTGRAVAGSGRVYFVADFVRT